MGIKPSHKTALIRAANEFLKKENCAAFRGPIGNGLFIAMGSKKDIVKLMNTK